MYYGYSIGIFRIKQVRWERRRNAKSDAYLAGTLTSDLSILQNTLCTATIIN